MISKEEFNKFNLHKRIAFLKSDGTCIAERYHLSYQVFLYTYSDFYVEVWMKVGLNMVQWIEIVNNPETLKMYVKDIDINDLLSDD